MIWVAPSVYAKDSLPPEVLSAKTIYLDNQTETPNVLTTAHEQFSLWGRFALVSEKDDADLVIVFTHKSGMDKWGNLGFTVMDVYAKGHSTPVYTTKDALHLITETQHPTRACIADFRKRVEANH